MEVKGFGLQIGFKMIYWGSIYDVDYIVCLQFDILCEDEKVDDIVKIISVFGCMGEVGDGKIIVYDVKYVVCICIGEINVEVFQNRYV